MRTRSAAHAATGDTASERTSAAANSSHSPAQQQQHRQHHESYNTTRFTSHMLAALPLLPAMIVALPELLRQREPGGRRGGLYQQLVASACLSVITFAGTVWLVPRFAPYLLRAGLSGKDLCKRGMPGGDKPM
jgi:hypothetical protein